MSFHVSFEIQVLFLASCAFGFGIALCRAAKSLSYLVMVVGSGGESLAPPEVIGLLSQEVSPEAS